MKVLIVDESPEVRMNLALVLNGLSPRIAVTEALNGKLALHALTRNAYDFIITELDMEGGSGETFIAHLKFSRLLKEKPIVVYSDRDFDDSKYDNIVHIFKALTPLAELHTIIKELIFSHFICPRCDEHVDGVDCTEACFYRPYDPKWKAKLLANMK